MLNLDPNELGKILEFQSLSLGELQQKTGTNKSSWSALFNGSGWFQWPTIVSAADALGIEPNYLAIAIVLRRISTNLKKNTKSVDADS